MNKTYLQSLFIKDRRYVLTWNYNTSLFQSLYTILFHKFGVRENINDTFIDPYDVKQQLLTYHSRGHIVKYGLFFCHSKCKIH